MDETEEDTPPKSHFDEDLATFSLPTEEEQESDEQVRYSVVHFTHSTLHVRALSPMTTYLQDDGESDQIDAAADYAGIPGWEKVDAIAEALLQLQGLSVTPSQSDNIKTLYGQLSDYDKAPLTYEARKRKAARGRFARSKSYRSGHVEKRLSKGN